ncbi:MAG: radical SAM family heme chaperone HemW [Gammaproteobacteria bacterium]|nr:radical SAM family heme chaperone HemW [Gammaproteobacteria bacterium]NND53746.1 radical SAM family heme chaperone HemW [Gammaproteobacteria bacterium]
MTGTLPPLSLYLHFPWCVAKCPYCDFNSHGLRGELPAAAYIDALLAELRQLPDDLPGRPLVSIFLGGGTPSLFAPADIDRLMRGVRDHLSLGDKCEVTLEANPGALEHGSFEGYLRAGVNRLSLGVQSFADQQLQQLGRVHSSTEAVAAFRAARSAGFDNINVDLMYALPGQTVAAALDNVQRALDLGPEHLSHYHLTLEPNTPFHARPPDHLPDDDQAWDMQTACAGELRAAGFSDYEVSAWARNGRGSVHNLNYWNFGDYIGLGAGAHGKRTVRSNDGLQVWREHRLASPRRYLRHAGSGDAAQSARVAPADLVFEFMLNALRLREGVPLTQFTDYTGLSVAQLEPALTTAVERDLLCDPDSGRIRPTARGWRFLDDLQSLFLPLAQKISR